MLAAKLEGIVPIVPIGAGVIISLGRKARELTKINVKINMAKMIKGAMY